MNPCKKCLIRPGCSKDCKEFINYSDLCTAACSLLAIILSGICFVTWFYHMGAFADTVSDKARMTIVAVWIITAFASIMMNVRTKEHLNDFAIIIFAPYVFMVFIYLYLFAYIFKRNIRKRA